MRIKTFVVNESMLPSREDFLKVVNSSDQRARTAILILASSGLRIGEPNNLKLKDVNMSSEPPTIRVRGMGAKERKGRITFMSDEAKACLEAYLERRKAMGHAIAEDSPLMARDDGNSMTQEYEPYTEDQLKKWYARAMPNLQILSKPIEEEKIRKDAALEAMRRVAETYGIDPMKVKIEKQKELGREPSPEEEIQTIQNEIKRMREHGDDPKKIVDEKELERYLGDGWDVQTVLPSGKILEVIP